MRSTAMSPMLVVVRNFATELIMVEPWQRATVLG